jgi:hypothetical protein
MLTNPEANTGDSLNLVRKSEQAVAPAIVAIENPSQVLGMSFSSEIFRPNKFK